MCARGCVRVLSVRHACLVLDTSNLSLPLAATCMLPWVSDMEWHTSMYMRVVRRDIIRIRKYTQRVDGKCIER